MSGRIRVLDAANRTMQRLGFLKPLCVIVNETETSNLVTLGKRFIERVSKRVRRTTPVDEQLREYAKARLTDGIFRELRKTILEGPPGATISLEVQDLLPSRPQLAVKHGTPCRSELAAISVPGNISGTYREGHLLGTDAEPCAAGSHSQR